MQIELRPLSTGEMLDRTFQLYRARFGMFLGIATIAAAIRTFGGALQALAFHFLILNANHHALTTLWTSSASLVTICIALLATSVVFAAVTRSVFALYLDQPTGIALAYREVWPRWFRYVKVTLAAGFLSGWPALLVLAALVVEIMLTLGHPAGSSVGRAAALGVTGLGMFIALPICVWLLCRYALSNVACVVEDLPVRKSIQRSIALTKDMRGRVFVLLLLVYILQLILVLALTAPTLGTMVHANAHIPLGITVYQLLAGFVVTALVSPLYGIGLTVLYLDARTRKEGFDIELMMGRTGMDAPWHGTASPEASAGFTAG
jgi:hypothetical protein